MANILVDDFRALMATVGERLRIAEAKAEKMSLLLTELHSVIRHSDGVAGWHLNGELASWESLGFSTSEIDDAIDTDSARAYLTRLFSTEADNSRLRQENRSLRMRNEQLNDRATDTELSYARLRNEADTTVAKLRAEIAQMDARPNSLTVATRMASLEGKTLSGAGVVAAVLAGAAAVSIHASKTEARTDPYPLKCVQCGGDRNGKHHNLCNDCAHQNAEADAPVDSTFVPPVPVYKGPGYTEGDLCNRNGCEGTIIHNKRRNCSCHLGGAPCDGCVYRGVICDECDALPDSENV